MEAFKRLRNWGRTGLAVLNEEGAIVDELSEKDLRALDTNAHSFLNLFKSVKEYKKIVREKYPSVPAVATLTEGATFEDVIRVMDQNATARVFIITPKDRLPLYTITQSDVLRQMFPHATSSR